MATAADIDYMVTEHLTYLARRDEALETVAEIAASICLPAGQVRAALKRLKSYGEAREVSEASSGGKTWALTSDSRFPA